MVHDKIGSSSAILPQH